MAGISRNPDEKAVWQQMAQHWLRMIPMRSLAGAHGARMVLAKRI
jgi:hypothetical protein